MSRTLDMESLALVTGLHAFIQERLEKYVRIKMHVCDYLEDHPGVDALGVLFASETAAVADSVPHQDGDGCRDEAVKGGAWAVIVGKPRHFQQFLNKEGPSYEEEFMLDLEFNYAAGICTIYNLNLPGRLRGAGLGAEIVRETERVAVEMGMEEVYVPSEHRAAGFWLRIGYHFRYPGESDFYRKNRDRTNLYVAYDMRKRLGARQDLPKEQ